MKARMPTVPTSTLSPHEYLEYLQREHYGAKLCPYAVDVGDVLSANLIASLPPEHRHQLDRIAIGVLPTKSVNASVRQIPTGVVIAFDFGTISFMLALNKILMSRVTLFNFEPTLDLRTAASRGAQAVKSFSGDEEFPSFAVTPKRMLVSAALSNVQTAFIVGHELGHFLLGHLRHHCEGWREQARSDNYYMEFAADARGAELVASSFRRSHDLVFGAGDTVLGQAGVDIFFTYMLFMERVVELPIASPNHPPMSERRLRLRERFWNDLPEPARALATAAEQTFDAFAEILENREY
jgi:hypothetical protein